MNTEVLGFFVIFLGPGVASIAIGTLLAIAGPSDKSWLTGLGLIGIGLTEFLFLWIWYRSACWETWQPCQDNGIDTLLTVSWGAAGLASLAGVIYGISQWQRARSKAS